MVGIERSPGSKPVSPKSRADDNGAVRETTEKAKGKERDAARSKEKGSQIEKAKEKGKSASRDHKKEKAGQKDTDRQTGTDKPSTEVNIPSPTQIPAAPPVFIPPPVAQLPPSTPPVLTVPPVAAGAPIQAPPDVAAQGPPSADRATKAVRTEPGRRWAALSEEERSKLRAAHDKAMADPAVRAVHDQLKDARRQFREVVRPAILKADPSVQPILEKLHTDATDSD